MDKIARYRMQTTVQDWLENREIKTVLLLLSVELCMLLWTAYKGLESCFLPVTLLMMLFSVIACSVAFYFEADRTLLITVLIMVDIGFVIQQMEIGHDMQVMQFLVRLIIAMGAALAAAVLYDRMADLISKDGMIVAFALMQYIICLIMIVLAQEIQSDSGQGAAIELHGVTPFELVKVLYVFVAVGLLCKPELYNIRLLKWSFRREKLLIIHTLLLALFFVGCGELGTLLIVCITGLFLLCIYGKNRRLASGLATLSAAGYVIMQWICEHVLYERCVEVPQEQRNIVHKLIIRFALAYHPEYDPTGYGYQGTRGLEAIACGGWLGVPVDLYKIPIPYAESDFIFANIVQTGGLLMGLMVILMVMVFMNCGFRIAMECNDVYFKGIASGITIVVVAEAVVHIGYNTAALPITGIPLYFVSQGFTAITTGMALLAVLLVISAGRAARTEV